jgi:nucleotidyltransferase/DNA polymerase involved in DNA repair
MSARVMKSISMLLPDVEIYSIDEAFARLDKDKGTRILCAI